MTRRQPLRQLLQNAISHGAMDYAGYPFMFRLGIDQSYTASCEVAPLEAPLTFLAMVRLWLRLALGLEIETDTARPDFIKFNVPRIHHRQVNSRLVRKSPAQNLEALMRFAPDAAGLGLTLNQYRERFTRLSVMGRARIYSYFICYRVGLHRQVQARVKLRGAMNLARASRCGAPLSPD